MKIPRFFTKILRRRKKAGVRYITLHPRTKADGYGPPARWDLIAAAKSFLKIPLVGNGDIRTAEDAAAMLKMTGCDALMIGRGSIMNPFLFHQIRAFFSKVPFHPQWEDLIQYFGIYAAELNPHSSLKQQVGKIKQVLSFFCKGNEGLMEKKARNLIVRGPRSSKLDCIRRTVT